MLVLYSLAARLSPPVFPVHLRSLCIVHVADVLLMRNVYTCTRGGGRPTGRPGKRENSEGYAHSLHIYAS